MVHKIWRSPCHIWQKKNGYYYFRIRVPADLVHIFRASEIKKSLKTENFRQAKALSARLALAVEVIITVARVKLLSDDDIRRLVSTYLHSSLQKREDMRAEGIIIPKGPEDLDRLCREARDEMLQLRTDLIYNRVAKAIDPVDIALKGAGLSADQQSAEYNRLCREMMKAMIEVLNVEMDRTQGRYDNWYDRKLMENNAFPAKPEGKSILLSEAIKEHIKEKKLKEKWTRKTEAENRAVYEIMLRAMGNSQTRELERPHFLDYLEILKRLPPNINKKRQYFERTIKEIIEIAERNGDSAMAVRTRNKYLERTSTLMEWCVEQGYADRNFARALLTEEDDDDKRDPYDMDDLRRLFTLSIYIEPKYAARYPERYWMPILGLHGAMRLDELCQLYLDDVYKVGETWVFDVNEEEDKKVKKKASIRLVPIHPAVIDLGFLDYVEAIRKAGHKRLWPALKKGRDGYSDALGKWYQRENRGHITRNKRKVYHSFRHTVIDTLKQSGVTKEIVAPE